MCLNLITSIGRIPASTLQEWEWEKSVCRQSMYNWFMLYGLNLFDLLVQALGSFDRLITCYSIFCH